MNATPWNVPIGRPNCLRVRAYGIGRVERGLGQADRQGADADPAAVERAQGDLEAVAALAEQVRGGNAGPFEDQLAGRRGVQAHLLLEPADAEPGRVGGHDERADLGAAVALGSCGRGSRPGSGGDDVRAGLAGIRDEALAAVEDPGLRRPHPSSKRAVVRVPPESDPAPGSVSP